MNYGLCHSYSKLLVIFKEVKNSKKMKRKKIFNSQFMIVS